MYQVYTNISGMNINLLLLRADVWPVWPLWSPNLDVICRRVTSQDQPHLCSAAIVDILYVPTAVYYSEYVRTRIIHATIYVNTDCRYYHTHHTQPTAHTGLRAHT